MYSVNQITDCYLDWYYKDFSSWKTIPVTTADWFYSWSIPKTQIADYPSYPVMNHFIDSDGTQVLQFACTGFEKTELDVKVEDDSLIIVGKRKGQDKDPKVKTLYNKLAMRDFEVLFKISEKLDAENITSSYKDGLLSVFIPLSPEIKKKNKKIEIK